MLIYEGTVVCDLDEIIEILQAISMAFDLVQK